MRYPATESQKSQSPSRGSSTNAVVPALRSRYPARVALAFGHSMPSSSTGLPMRATLAQYRLIELEDAGSATQFPCPDGVPLPVGSERHARLRLSILRVDAPGLLAAAQRTASLDVEQAPAPIEGDTVHVHDSSYWNALTEGHMRLPRCVVIGVAPLFQTCDRLERTSRDRPRLNATLKVARLLIPLLAAGAFSNTQAKIYTWKEILPPPSWGVYVVSPQGLNGAGDVTGSVQGPNFWGRGFLYTYSDGQYIDIPGAWGGRSINDSQLIATQTGSAMWQGCNQPAIYDLRTGELRSLIASCGNIGGYTAHVNNHGQATGVISGPGLGDWYTRPFIYENGSLTTIGEPGVHMSGSDINDRGEVLGDMRLPDGRGGAFVWANGSITVHDLSPCSPHAYCHTNPKAINDSGHFVGFFSVRPPDGRGAGSHAFIYTPLGGVQDLGAFPAELDNSVALDVNNADEVVGRSNKAGVPTGSVAFVYSPADGLQDLNQLVSGSLPCSLSVATAINDLGQIVARCDTPGMDKRGFLLTPANGDQVLFANVPAHDVGALVSGYDDTHKSNWVFRSFDSRSSTLDLNVNMVPWNVFAPDTVIAFGRGAAPTVIRPGWTQALDKPTIDLRPTIEFPVVVWLAYEDADSGLSVRRLADFAEAQFATMNYRFFMERVGLQSLIAEMRFVPGASLARQHECDGFLEGEPGGTSTRDRIGYKAEYVNVYYVGELYDDDASLNGVACGRNTGHPVILLAHDSSLETVVHEFGHLFSLDHPDDALLGSIGFDDENIMWSRPEVVLKYFSEGQTQRIHFNEGSVLNSMYGAHHPSELLMCVDDPTDSTCAPLFRRIWPDGAMPANGKE